MKTEPLKENKPITIIEGFSKKRIEFNTLIFTDGKIRKKDKPEIISKLRGYYGIYNVESIIKQNTYYKDFTYLVKIIVKGNGKHFKNNDIIKTYKYIHTPEDKKAMQKIKIILDELNSKSSINHSNKARKRRPNHN